MSNDGTEPVSDELVIERLAYLAGPIEFEGDTWRTKAAEKLEKLGFKAIDPLRNERFKRVGKHLESHLADKTIVERDLNDLRRVLISGGIVVANLATSSTGREPIGTLFELMWAKLNNVPVIGILKGASPNIKTHPFVLYCCSYEANSVTEALEAVEKYFK